MDIDKLLSEETVGSKKTIFKETVSGETAGEPAEVAAGTGGDASEKALAPVEQKETKPKKRKGKPRGGNSPVIGNNGLMVEPGDNARFMTVNMALFNMEDIDLNNVEEVRQRLNDYFALYTAHDMKPTVAGMALALNGMSRRTLWAIVNDAPTGGAGYTTALPPEVARSIKKAYKLMENLWETYMNSGKVNPVAGIFLGKNNYGYQDKTEYVLTPNAGQETEYSAEEIRERYIAADQTKRLSEGQDEEQND